MNSNNYVVALEGKARNYRWQDKLAFYLTSLFWPACIILFFSLCVVSFKKLDANPHGGLFFSWDAQLYLAYARDVLSTDILSYFPASYSQSLGNIVGRPSNFNILPEFVFTTVNNQFDPILMYTVSSILFFISTYFLSKIFGGEKKFNILAGLFIVLLTMPLSYPPVFLDNYWYHGPQWVPPVIGMSMLLITTFYIGKKKWFENIFLSGLVFFEIIWVMLAFSKASFLLFIAFAIYYLAFVVISDTKREFAWKMVSALVLVSMLAMLGPLEYMKGMYGFNASNLLNNLGTDISFNRDFFATISKILIIDDTYTLWEIFCASSVWIQYIFGFNLIVLALIGCVLSIFQARKSKVLCAAAVSTITTILLATYILSGSPMMGSIVNILAIFALYTITNSLAWLLKLGSIIINNLVSTRKSVNNNVEALLSVCHYMLLFAIVGFVIYLISHEQISPGGYSAPARTPLTSYLEQKIKFSKEDSFKGRFLNMAFVGKTNETSSGPLNIAYEFMISATKFSVLHGNDLFNGLMAYDVPVTVEYNRMGTPFSFLFFQYLLMKENIKNRIDSRLVTRFNPKILQLIGVRYVLSDEPNIDPNQVKLIDEKLIPEFPTLKLVELKNPNIGQYSPLRIKTSRDFVETLETMNSPNFDPTEVAVMNKMPKGMSDKLVKASSVNIKYTQNGIQVEATSEGQSIIVLPFEYSHCLKPKGDMQNILTIGRANLLLTYLLFKDSIDLQLDFEFGPLKNTHCRKLDLQEMKDFGISADSFNNFRKKYPGLFLIYG